MLTDTTMRFSEPALASRLMSGAQPHHHRERQRPRSLFCVALICACLAAMPLAAFAQSAPLSVWQGEWQVEATLFTLKVSTEGNRFFVDPVRPLGIEWTSTNGTIDGNTGTIQVKYQGVSAQVMVQLISDSSAIVRSLSCQPDYHVICTLVQNQQALFTKLTNANQTE